MKNDYERKINYTWPKQVQGIYFENEIRKEEAIVSLYVQSPQEITLS